MVDYTKKYPQIAEDKLLKKYFRKRDLAQGSIDKYIYTMQIYRHVTGLTPTKAIEEADNDEEDGTRLKKRNIVQHLGDFEDFLDEKYSENTLKTSMATVKSFYRFNDIIELPVSQRRKVDNKQYPANIKELPNRDDILKGISFCPSVKYQGIILLGASSGMRQGDMRRLRLWQLTEATKGYIEIGVDELNNIPKLRKKTEGKIGPLWWDFYMQKGRRCHTTFSTPESLNYIFNYLETRNEIESLDEYLFPGNGGGELRKQSLNDYFGRINTRCQFPKRSPIYFRPQNLRKWFANKLKKTELGYTETRLLLGHRVLDDTGRRYLVPDFGDLYEKYYRSMGAVTLFNKVEVHNTTNEEVKEVREEIKGVWNLLFDMADDPEEWEKARLKILARREDEN